MTNTHKTLQRYKVKDFDYEETKAKFLPDNGFVFSSDIRDWQRSKKLERFRENRKDRATRTRKKNN